MSHHENETFKVSPEYVKKYNTEAFIRAAEEYKTAGIRGTLGETLEEGVINAGNFRIYAQARSQYIKKHYLEEQQAIFIGRDERLFSYELAYELARVYAGNGIKVYIGKNSSACPITSYTGWAYGIPADLVSASHNAATKAVYYNGIKPSSDSGGLISEDETNEIIESMKAICEGQAVITRVASHDRLIEEVDPLPAYIEHLRNNLSPEDLRTIGEAGKKGAVRSYWATYGGAAGPSLERINRELLGKDWENYIYRLHWEPDYYFHGYGEKPDPSDPAAFKGMILKEGILRKMIDGEVSFVQSTDGDGDRVGLMCRCPDHLLEKARDAGLMIYDEEGKTYDETAYSKNKPGVVYMLPYQIFVLLTYMRLTRLQAAGHDLSSYVIIASYPTPYFERIADHFKCTFIQVPVGFRWLNLTAGQIEAGREYVELEEVHWGDEGETLRHYIGKDKQIVVMCEESGGINFGNIREEENKIGHKSKIAKEKDAIKAFFLIQLEASRMALKGKTLVDVYVDIVTQRGFGNSHFKRSDLSLTSESGSSIKAAFMDFYTELYRTYEARPGDLKIAGVKGQRIFRAGDGVKVILEDGSWLYVRPSGTEPKLKIFSWASSPEETERLQQAVLSHRDELASR
jgi:phosphoglucomutase